MDMKWTVKSICKVEIGKSYYINSIHLDVISKRKLQNLGIILGAEIIILQGGINCSYLIEVNDSRLMIDWDTAKGIRVKTGK